MDYGWVTFRNMHSANNALKEFKRKQPLLDATRVCISPPAKDIVWPNMSIPQAMRNLKIWFGRGVFFSFMFVWLIPSKCFFIYSRYKKKKKKESCNMTSFIIVFLINFHPPFFWLDIDIDNV